MNKKRLYMLFATTIIAVVMVFISFESTRVKAEISEGNGVKGAPNTEADKEIEKRKEEIQEEIELDGEELETKDDVKVKEGKGKLYNKYKDGFDDWAKRYPGASLYVELIKDLDYAKGKFECGKFDVICHVVNLGYTTGNSIINAFMSPLSKLAISPEDIFGDTTLTKFKGVFSSFTYSLLGVFILFQIMKIYSYRMSSHYDTITVINDKVLMIGMATILLVLYDKFFKFILTIQYRVNYGIFNYLSNTEDIVKDLTLSLLLTPDGLMFIILILIFAILMAVLFLQMLYSFALISLFYVVGPVAITTMVNDNYNVFDLWLKTIISRFLTLGLQGMCVVLSFSFGSRIDGIFAGDPTELFMDKLIALAFLMVALGIPSLLKEFGNSTGSGRGAIAGVKSVTRVFSK